MQCNKLIENIDTLTELHEKLLAISHTKTEAIKSGKMDELQKLLMQERKQIQLIEQAEENRQVLVDTFFNEKNVKPEEKTVSVLMNYLDEDKKKAKLDQAVANLVTNIVQLKQKEQLNKDLINQSMQFVQLSLDMLQPSMKNLNYTKNNEENETVQRSVFDSKA